MLSQTEYFQGFSRGDYAGSCFVVGGLGLDGAVAQAEVDVANGIPSFFVGLPDTAMQESRKRMRAAVKYAGLSFPFKRGTVNLDTADLRKEDSANDLGPLAGVARRFWAGSSLRIGRRACRVGATAGQFFAACCR